MSTVTASLGSARNSSHAQRLSPSTSPVIVRSQSSREVCGVGPAESTGKSSVTYWPGGTRSLGASSRSRPLKPREIGGISSSFSLWSSSDWRTTACVTSVSGSDYRKESRMSDHEVVDREEWAAAREALLAREKEHTRRSDELARQRRELPWVRVEKEYRFDTDDGRKTLAQLFDEHQALLVYHLMLGPEYEAACPACSSIADGFNGLDVHLANRADTRLVAVSRAPLEKLRAYKR